jgi:hypothetical protein
VNRISVHSRADAGSDEIYWERLLDALAWHERKHIEDFQDFMDRGIGGKLMLLMQGGLLPLPSAIRARIERRAQLNALRNCIDPRIPLARCIAALPVEGARRASEHASGYAMLMAEFVAAIDAGAFEGGEDLAQLDLSRELVLLQQLDRLSPESVRAVARALSD